MLYNNQLKITTIILSGALLISACKNESPVENSDSRTPIMVTTAAPQGSTSNGINVSGQITSVQTANISTRIMGTITRIFVNVGDKVQKGQLLATISSQDIVAKKGQAEAAIAEAEANVKNAEKDFERFNNLYNKKSASAKELDNVTLQYNAAKAKLEAATQMRNEANALIAYSKLTAPFNGVVSQKIMDEGNMASPGMPILTIEQAGQLQVSATVSESDINSLKKGDKAEVSIKAIDKKIECTVSEISPSSQFSGGQYFVKLTIPQKENKGLYAGMYVNLFIPTNNSSSANNESSVLVPVSSLVQTDQLTGIYTISNENTALLRWIRTGKTYGDKIEVLSGLAIGEKFILSADGKLYNGVPVTAEN